MLPAYDFLISDNQIKFLYEKKLAVENLNNLERIIITQYRYIFIFNDNKYIVNRIKGIFKWEKILIRVLVTYQYNMILRFKPRDFNVKTKHRQEK